MPRPTAVAGLARCEPWAGTGRLSQLHLHQGCKRAEKLGEADLDQAGLAVLQEVRCNASELSEMARKAGRQVVYGEEFEGTVLVAAFAWTRALQKISRSPTGLSHHFQWKVGGQSLHVRNGYFRPRKAAYGRRAHRVA